MPQETAETLAQGVVTLCANCDQCRDLLADAPCQFFPRLYNLSDRVAEGGPAPSTRDLKDLIDLCNACGQCPCTSVQVRIRDAKDAFVARDGLPLGVRLIEDVQLVGKLCGMLPQLTNRVMASPVGGVVKRALGIHPERALPQFPSESFDAWAKARGLDALPTGEGRKVAYFVGCSARYMFPEVAKATVEVLEANGIAVHVPEQKCCGMPTYLEGDRAFTFRLADSNLPTLKACIEAGCDIVTACPTCSFALKTVLGRGAAFSPQRRERVLAMLEEEGGDVERVRARLEGEALAPTGRANAASEAFRKPWVLNQLQVKPAHGYDDGYFAALDPDLRILIASHTWELGEYLRDLEARGELRASGPLTEEKRAYFPPCHLREQGMGRPWQDLLRRTADAELQTVGEATDCCGLGGVMGFKKTFHWASLAMGRGLMERTAAMAPERVVTECLGCRVQFNQMLPYPVSHPVELLAAAYRRQAEAAE